MASAEMGGSFNDSTPKSFKQSPSSRTIARRLSSLKLDTSPRTTDRKKSFSLVQDQKVGSPKTSALKKAVGKIAMVNILRKAPSRLSQSSEPVKQVNISGAEAYRLVKERIRNAAQKPGDERNKQDIQTLREFLESVDLFRESRLDENQMIQLCRMITFEDYNKGGVVFREGEPGFYYNKDALFFIHFFTNCIL